MKNTSILFVDSSVSNYEILLKNIVTGIEAIVLEPEKDGVAQITQILSDRTGVESVHIVSHGSPGTLYLGNSQLSLSTLERYTEQLQTWFPPTPSLPYSPTPSLLLYGCNVVAGDAGAEFIAKLHQLTGANIAASTTKTGNAALGGNWDLEVTVGSAVAGVQTLAFQQDTLAAYPGVLVAPILNSSIDLKLGDVSKNTSAPTGMVGTLVSSLVSLSTNVTDSDSTNTGIAITNVDISNGTLYYSVDNGSNWLNISNVGVSETNALLLAADTSARVYFQPNTNYTGLVNNLITFRAWDQSNGLNGLTTNTTTNGGATAFSGETDTVAISVNTAPILDSSIEVKLGDVNKNATAPIDGQVAGTLVSELVKLTGMGVNVTDPDTGAMTGIAITTFDSNNGSLFYSINDGANWTKLTSVSQTTALVLAADSMTRLYFQPNTDYTGIINDLITFHAWDQTTGMNGQMTDTTVAGVTAFSSATDTAAITVNTAPTLDSSIDVKLWDVNKNATAPVDGQVAGTLVSELVKLTGMGVNVTDPVTGAMTGIANVTDPDMGAMTGIAITSFNSTDGSLFYSINDGANWTKLTSVSQTSALVLAADSMTRLYFQPNTDYTGTVSDLITFHAWDQTTGMNGQMTDTTVAGVTAFSSATDTAAITVNTAPILDSNIDVKLGDVNKNATAPVDGQVVGTLVSDLVKLGTGANVTDPVTGAMTGIANVTDPDMGAMTGIAITSFNSTDGSLFYSINDGANWTKLTSVSQTSALVLAADSMTRLYFQPNTDYTGTVSDLITFHAWDQTTGMNGKMTDTTVATVTAFSSATDTAAITVNTAPILDSSIEVKLADVNKNATAPVDGQVVGTLVSDLVKLGTGANVTDPVTGAMTGIANVTDPDMGAMTGIAITSFNSTDGSLFYSINDGANWTKLTTASQTSALLLAANANTRLYFQPTANYTGTVSDVITFSAWDQTTGTNGQIGVNTTVSGTTTFSTATDVAAITVIDATTTNTAPTFKDTEVKFKAINKNAGEAKGVVGTLVSDLVKLDVHITDSDSNSLTGIAITNTNTTNGSLFYSLDNGSEWKTLSVSDNNAFLLAADLSTRIYFQPKANFNGKITNAITFRAWDQTDGSNGSTFDATNGFTNAFSSVTKTALISVNTTPTLSNITVNLNAINKGVGAPTGQVGTLISSLVSIGTGGNVTDDDTDALTGIAITSIDTTKGSWFYSTNNGSKWEALASASVTTARLLAADTSTRIYFQPNANFSGDITSAISFRAWDQTIGSNGLIFDTTDSFTNAFSSVTSTAALTVNNVTTNPPTTNPPTTNPPTTNPPTTNPPTTNPPTTNPPTTINNNFTLKLQSNNIFQFQGDSNSGGKAKIKISLSQQSSNFVNELGVFVVDDEQGKINGIAPGAQGYTQAALAKAKVIFSSIANVPNGFNTDLSSIVEFNSQERVRFLLVKNSTVDAVVSGSNAEVLFADASQNVTDKGNGEFSLAWKTASNSSTSVSQDFAVSLKTTNETVALGTGLQGTSQGELLDFRSVTSQVKAEFTVNREAAYNNYVGFYKIADITGGIDTDGDGKADLRPGEAGYAQAAVRDRLTGMDLTVSNQGTSTFSGTFAAGSLFAPFLIANGDAEAFLSGKGNKDLDAYFTFLSANSGKVDHVRLLGNNCFGFEDKPMGGDMDYNDITVKIKLSVA